MTHPRITWKRAFVAALLFVSIPFALLATTIVENHWERFRRCRGNTRFESNKWNDSTLINTQIAARDCMVDDFLERHPLRGKTRTEVVSLLGEPRPTQYFRDYDLVYWLGPERSLISIDSNWLVVKLDSTGRVEKAGLVTD